MPDYLSEANWKRVLDQPKNLGLKAQKIGVSRMLHQYEKSNANYEDKPNQNYADMALRAVQALKAHAQDQSGKHPAFTDATKYLKQIVAAAKVREKELSDKVDEHEAEQEKNEERKTDIRSCAQKMVSLGAQAKMANTLGEVLKILGDAEKHLTEPAQTHSKVKSSLADVKKAITIVEGQIRTRDNQPEDMQEKLTNQLVPIAKKRADDVIKQAQDALIESL